jgi:uncharacterized protein YbjQ (UPF0145 family)
MKKLITSLFALIISMSVISIAQARDTKYLLPISTAISTNDATEKLDGSVKFYFAKQAHPRVLQDLGTFVSNRKTNAFGKSDANACRWAFLSALVTFQQRAKKEGGNAVINIVSYYKKNEMASTSLYECHAGATVAGVALKGDVVKLAK